MLWDWSAGGANGTDIELDGESDVPGFVDRVAGVVDGPTRAFAESFPDVDALIDAQRAERPVDGDSARPPRSGARGPSMADLVLVLAAGRLDEARVMLAKVEAVYADRGLDRRFTRQVRRRLDAGTREVPPLEDTLARLPTPTPPEASSWSSVRDDVGVRRAAGRGPRPSPREDRRRGGRGPGRRVRDAGPAGAADEPRARRRADAPGPAALRPSPGGGAAGAAARVRGQNGRRLRPRSRRAGAGLAAPTGPRRLPLRDHATTRRTAVLFDPGIDALLSRIQAATLHHLSDAGAVHVWFSQDHDSAEPTADGQRAVVVHIGSDRVGVVPPEQAAGFPAMVYAAELFDEDPVATATLTTTGA